MKAVIVLMWLTLASCAQRQPKMSDAQLQKLRALGISDACLAKAKWDGESIIYRESCTDRLPPRRWRGLFRNDFEGPTFCPEPAKSCRKSYGPELSGIWLDLGRTPEPLRDVWPGGLYQIDFIGRETAHGTPYAPFAADIIVDRLISIRQVEPPPK